MACEAIELIEAPDTCEETTEYDNIIEEEVETEPDQERESSDAPGNWLDMDHAFARYERNYRARRIRELTVSPLTRRRRNRRHADATRAAA